MKPIGYANLCVILCTRCAPKTAGRRPHLWMPIMPDHKDADDECSTCGLPLNRREQASKHFGGPLKPEELQGDYVVRSHPIVLAADASAPAYESKL